MDPTLLIGGSLLSGLIGSSAAKKAAREQAAAARYAADQQLAAAREANQLLGGMYQQGLMTQAPYLRAGQQALGALTGGLGLGGYGAPAAAPGAPGAAPGGRMTIGGQGEPMMTAGGPGGPMLTTMPVGGSVEMPETFTDASGRTVDAAGNPVIPPAFTPQNYGATPEEMAAAGQAYGGRFTERFTPQDIYSDPSYQFRLDEGLKALKAARAATGTLQTGQGLKDITDYAQRSASQEYQSAYERFRQQQEAAYQKLASLAGLGSTTGAGMAGSGMTAGQAMGQNIVGGARGASDYLTSGAAAGAAGTMGAAQALGGGLTGGIQNWMGLQLLKGVPGFGYKPPTPGLPMGYTTPGSYTGGGYGTDFVYGPGPQ